MTSYQCCRMAWGGLIDATPVGKVTHLVTAADRGTPGPTLCGIDRFAKTAPGWSMHQYLGEKTTDPHSGRPIRVCDLCETVKCFRDESDIDRRLLLLDIAIELDDELADEWELIIDDHGTAESEYRILTERIRRNRRASFAYRLERDRTVRGLVAADLSAGNPNYIEGQP